MVVPTQILLKPLKNTYRDGLFTPQTPSLVTDFVVNSDTPVTVGAVHKEDVKKLLFSILNTGANSLDISFFGAGLDDDSHGTEKPFSPPPDDASIEWVPLPSGTATVPNNGNDARNVTDNWTWVMIQVARTTSGQNAILTLRIRGE